MTPEEKARLDASLNARVDEEKDFLAGTGCRTMKQYRETRDWERRYYEMDKRPNHI